MSNPQVKLELKIVFDGHNVSFFGPVDDKILCLGMIELAKQIILSGAQVHKKPPIGPPPMLNGHNNNPPA